MQRQQQQQHQQVVQQQQQQHQQVVQQQQQTFMQQQQVSQQSVRRVEQHVTHQVTSQQHQQVKEMVIQGSSQPAFGSLPGNISPPVFEQIFRNARFAQGGNALFEGKVRGQPNPVVSWTRKGAPLLESTKYKMSYDEQSGRVALLINTIGPGDEGEYTCTAQNQYGEAICSVYIQPEGQLQPQVGGHQKEYAQTFESTEQAQSTFQRYHKQTSEKMSSYSNGHIVEEDFKVDTFEYRLLREVEFRESITCRYTQEIDSQISTVVERSLGPVAPPQIAQKPRNSKLNEGSEATFQAKITGNPRPRLTWFKNGQRIKSSQKYQTNFSNQQATLKVQSVNSSDSGHYTLLAENPQGCVVSSAYLAVEQSSSQDGFYDGQETIRSSHIETNTEAESGKTLAPNFVRVCADREVTEGKMTRFDCRVTGRPYPEVAWFINGHQVSDDTTHKILVNESGNHALMITNVHRSDAGVVSCVARNKSGETSFQCNLVVIEKEQVVAPKFVERFTTVHVKEGEPVVLNARAVGTPVPRITWQKDGVPITPGPNIDITTDSGASTLDIPRAKASDAAWYQCTAQNVAGSTATRARLFVETPKSSAPQPRRLNLPKPTKVIEPELQPGPEVIYLRHVERAKPHTPLPEEDIIYPPPQFIIPLSNVQQAEGGRVHFEARIEPVGDPTMRVEWFINGRPLEASSRATTTFRFGFIALDLISLIMEDSGEYICRVTSSSGSVQSQASLSVTARVSIEQSSQHPDSLQYIQQLEDYSSYQRQESLEDTIYQRPNFIRPLQNLGELQEGRNAHFEAQLTPVSDPTMKVEWYKDGKTITASSRITTLFNFGYVSLNIMHLRVEDAGTYTVRAVNRLGEAVSSSNLKVLARTSVTGDLGIPEQQRYIEKVEELEAYQQQQQYKYVQEVPESTSAPEFKSPIKDQLNIREGGFAHFEARLEPIGDSTLKVEWLRDGHPVEASSRITSFFNFGYVALTIKYVTTHDIGIYTCRAYNNLGQATTSANLTVVSKKDIILDSQHPSGLEKIQYLEDSSRYGRSVHEESVITQKPMFLGPLKGTNKIVEAQRAHFEVRVEPQNDMNMTIEWYFNGKAIMSANRIHTYYDFGYIALDIESVRSEDAGTYTVVARNALGEAQISATMEVETRSSIDTTSMHHGTYEKTQRIESSKFVEPQYHIEEISKSKPIFVQPLQDPKPVTEGKNIHLECRLEPMGDPTMRVEWFYNGRAITVGSRFRTYYDFGYVALDIVHATSLDSGEYTVRAVNHLGSAHTSACVRVLSCSDILTESQNEAALEQIHMLEDSSRYRSTAQEDLTIMQAPQFTRPLHNIETVEGTNIHLECRLQPVGDPTMRVDWFVNGQPVKTGHRFRPAYDFDYVALDLLSVYAVDSGVYTCQARNQLGEAVTSCSVKIIAKKDLILESQHPSGLEKIQYLEDASRYKRTEYIDEVVNIKPRFVTKPKNLENMREGQHAHFECKLEPVTDTNLKVEWYKNGRPITVGHRFRPIHDFGYVALDIIDLIAEDSGTYTCRAVNLVGADETTCVLQCRSTAQIVTGTQNETGLEQIQYLEDRSRYQKTEFIEETTKQAPIFTTSLKHIEIREGQRAHFECRLIPVSDPTMKVEWFHNNVPVKSGSRFTETNNFGFVALDIMYCYPEDSGTYTCRARNALGEAVTSANLTCHSKKSIYMESQHENVLSQLNYLEDSSRYQRQTVQEETVTQAPVFTQPMRDVKCAENQAAHFEARLIPVGDSNLRVDWLRNGVPIQASNRVTTMHDFGYVALNMKYVYPEDSGTYTCRAVNELGQAVTSATLVVHSKASLLLESQHEAALQKLHMLEDTSRYQRREEQEIIVTQAPKFTAQLNGPVNLVEGQSAHYECRIEPYPDPNLKVEWFHNGKPLQTGHRFRTTYDFGFAALDILTVYGEDSGEYTCKATNKLGQATSSIKVNVKSRSSIILDTQHEGALQKIQYLEDDSRHKRPAAEEAVIAEKPQFGRPLRNVENLPEGLSAHLEATLTPVNDPTMKVEWFCNGRPIPQGHRFKTTYDFGFVALDILYAYAEDSGTYMCKARNAVGEAVTTCSVKVQAKSGLYLDTLDEQRLQKIRDLEAYERPQKTEAEPEAQRPVFITPLNNLEHLKEGDHAHLECRVEPINDSNLKIEWFVNGVAIKTGHRFRTTHDFGYVALDVLYTYPEDSGTYMCKATNLVGEAVNTCTINVAARRSIYLESQHPEGLQKIQELEAQGRPGRLEVEEPIPTPPRFVTEFRGTTELVEGQTAHFEAQVEPLHDPNLRIELYHNGKPLPSASRFHITFDFGYLALDINHIVPEDAGEYTAKAINALGQCTSSIKVRVQGKSNIILESQRPEGLEKIRQLEEHTPFQRPEIPEPTRQRPVFTQPLQNIDAIAEGQTAHFECRLIPVGDPTLKVEWFRNEKPLETSSRITKTHDFGYVALDMTHVRGEDDGVYMCRASNALGEAVTTASMKIKTKANIQLETQHPEGMKKIQQLEEGRVPTRRDEPDQAFEKPIFTQVLTGPSELWESQNAHFECRVVPVGDPSLHFEWYVNGVELKMGTRFHVTHDFGFVTLDINKVITEDSGVYMCKAINKAGEAVSSTSMKVKSKSSIMGEPMQPDAWQKIQLKEAEMNKVPEMFVDTTPQQAPVFTTHLVSHDKLHEGQYVLLEAQVEPRADPNLRVEWFKNGITLTTGTRIRSTFDFGLVTLNINGLRADDSAIYTCKATNLLGEAVSTCTLKIEDRHWLLGSSLRPEALPHIEALEQPKVTQSQAPEPVYESPVFITHLNNVECREGDSVHFECHVEPSKDPTLSIEWFVNGKPLPTGARFKSTYDFGYVALDINHAYAEDSGVYMCKATNSKGQASTSGTLKCTSKQNIYLDTQHPQGKAGLEKVEEVDEAYAARLQRQKSAPDAQYPKPVFIVPLQPQFSLGENEALHLECQVEPKEDPNLKVEWYFNGKTFEHGSRFKMTCDFGFVTLDLTDVYERDQGIYTCKAHNEQGEAFTSTTVYCTGKSNLIEHTQHPKGAEGLEKIQDLEESLRHQEGAAPDSEEGHPPVFTSQFQNLKNLSEGEIAHFEASLTPIGDQTMVVEWFYNGEVLKASHRTRTVHAFGMVVLEILGTKIEDSGTYICKAVNKWGQAEISVELDCIDKSKGQKPQFTTQIQSLEGLKDGDSAHFECTLIPVGDPNLKVEWFHNSQPIRHSSRIKTVSDFGFVVLDIAYVQSHDSGEYICRASNKYGEDFTQATIKCQGKGGVYLDTLQPDSLARIRELEVGQSGLTPSPSTPIMEPPIFTTHISDITQLVEGQSAHFEARLTPVNDPNLTVEWFYNGKKLPHGHRYRTFHDFGIVILDILYCYEENSGVYECRAVNKVGQDVTKATLKCVSKASLILDSQLPRGMEGGLEKIQNLEDSLLRTRGEKVSETRGQAPVFTVPLSNIDSLREGENAHFEARLTPTDDPKLKVEWFWNGKPLKTGSRFRTFCDFGFVILEISPVYPEDSGEYCCRAFNDYGEAVTTATMKVQGKRSIILESQLPKGMENAIEKIAELEGLGAGVGQTSPDEDTGKPPEFITTPADLTLAENSLAHFECRLTPVNDPSMRVEWFHNGKALSAGSRIKTINDFGFVILEVAGVYQRDSGLYTCKATNRHGEATVSCKLQVRGRQGIILEPQLPSKFRTGTESIQKLEESLYKKDEILAEEEKPNPPKFVVELKDISDVPEGGPVHFECRVEPVGDSSMRIDWFHNGRPFATGSRVHMLNDFGFIVLDMDYTYARDSGEYVCRATNKWGSAMTKATLTCKAKHDIVLESQLPQGMSGEKLKELERGPLSKPLPEDSPLSPPKFITQIISVGIGEGEPVHFECRVEPKTDPKLRVEWYRNGKPLPSGHRFRTMYDLGYVSLDILYTYPEDSGEYVCRAVNDLGEDTTRATVSCKQLPTIILQNQVPKGMKKSEALMQMEATIKKYTSEVHLTEGDLYDPDKKQPPRFVTQIKDQTTLVEMQSTKFECQLAPVGDPNMKVEWFLNGKPLPHKNRFTPIYDFGYVAMNFGWVYPEDSGEYLCRATNLYGMDETRAVIKTAGKPGIIYESQLPKGMKSIERIREMEAAWQVVPEEPDEGEKPKAAPVFVTKPEPYTATEGEPARYCCRVTGYPRPRVMWVVNGHTVVNGTRYKLTYDGMWHLDIPKTRQYDNGKVEVIARNSAGEAVATTDLVVKQRNDDYRNVLKNSPRHIIGTKEYRKPEWVTHMEELQEALRATQCVPTFVQDIKDSRAKENESVTFECLFSGNPMPDVTWYKNEKSLRSTKNVQIRIKDNKTTCTILKATPEDEGTYICKAVSEIGTTTTRAKLYVQDLSLEEKKQLELKKAKEEEEKIRLEKVKLEKIEKRHKRKGTLLIEADGKRETADVAETQALETTTTFTDKTEQVTAKKIIPIQDSIEISAVASCKKVDEDNQLVVVPEEKAKPIVPMQEPVHISETQVEGTLKDLKQKRTRKVAERKAPVQESVAVAEVTAEEVVKEFVDEHVQQQAQHKLSVQSSVNVSEIISDTTIEDITTEEIETAQALQITSVQKSVVVSEIQSEATVKEFEETLEFEKAQKKVPVQESVTISEIQTEAAVEELLENIPRTHHAKTEKRITSQEKAIITAVKPETTNDDIQISEQVAQSIEQEVIINKKIIQTKEESEKIILAQDILNKEQNNIATEIEELMNFIQAKEFGPGESPLRDLACIGYLVRHGVAVNEITALYQNDRFPALQTPIAQSALVQLVEREGHGALISQVLTEESTTDEAVVGETVGFRAFMRMVELKHATVEEVITHFAPDDFRPCAWEAQEAVEVIDKGTVQQKAQVTQEAEILVQEKRKQKKKNKQKQDVDTEGDISLPSLPITEQVSSTISEEKQSIGVTFEELQAKETTCETVHSTPLEAAEEEGKVTSLTQDVTSLPRKVPKKKKLKVAVEDKIENSGVEEIVPQPTVVSEKASPNVVPCESITGVLITSQNITDTLPPISFPTAEEAKFTVDEKNKVVVSETETRGLAIPEKAISEEEVLEETTKEIPKQKSIADKAERVLVVQQAVERTEVRAESSPEELDVTKEEPEEALLVEDKKEEISISEVALKESVKTPSKKRRTIKKPHISEDVTPADKAAELRAVVPVLEKGEEIIPVRETSEVLQVTPGETALPLRPEKPAQEESKMSEELSPRDVASISAPEMISKKKLPKEKKTKEMKNLTHVETIIAEDHDAESTVRLPVEDKYEIPKQDVLEERHAPEKESQVKKPKPQKVQSPLHLMKIERKEIKPTKLKITEVTPKEEVPLFAQVKLRKSSIQKREIKSTEVPKVMLKSNLKVIEYPPLEQTPIVTLINVKPDKGILSRNAEEALKLRKPKMSRRKITDKEEVEIEEPESFVMSEEDVPQEDKETADKSKWEKTPKKKQEEDAALKELIIGKGKVPEAPQQAAEDIKLKKIPEKPPEKDILVDEKPKKKEPKDITVKDTKEKRQLEGLSPFVGEDIEGHDVELERYEKVEPDIPKKGTPKIDKTKKSKAVKPKPEPEVVEIPLKLGKPKEAPTEEQKDITFKKKMGEPIPEVPEEIKLKPFEKSKEKPSVETINVPAPKPKEEEKDDGSIIIKQQRGKSPEERKNKAKKPKSKEKTDEKPETFEITFPKPDVKPQETEESVIIKKPAPKASEAEEVSEEITLKPAKEILEVEEVITLKKESQKPIEDITEEITVRKMKPKETEHEEVFIQDVTIKLQESQSEDVEQMVTLLKKKPQKHVTEEGDEITIKKMEPQKPEQIEEKSTDITLKPKATKRQAEVSEEITLKKTQPVVPKETKEVENIITLKKKKPPVSEDITEEITLKREIPAKTEDVSEEVTLPKKKKERPIQEVTEEITIKKLVPKQEEDETDAKIEDITEEFVIKKAPKKEPTIEEISEEITLKPKPRKKPGVTEVTEVETVTIRPQMTKTKEEIEQEFKIQLQTYEEEDISMSSRVRLKKQRPMTYAEEAGEQTIRITQEIEEGPEEIIEIIEEEVPEEGVTIELKRKPSYRVEEPEEEEVIQLGRPHRPSEDIEGNFQIQLKCKQEAQQIYNVEEVEEEFKIGLKKEILAPRGSLFEEESLALKLKPKKKPSKTLHQEAVSLSITKETEVFEEGVEEVVVTEHEEGDKFYSLCSYVTDNEEALNLVEGERIYIIETHNSDWWFVRKHLTEEKGWVPAQLLMDEASYTLYVQKKLHEKIDKLPVFEKPASQETVTAPRFIEKLQPKHTSDGAVVQFVCQVEGNPRPQVAWFRQTAIILPSTDFQIFYDDSNVATLIIKEAFPEDAGTYTCVAKNAAGFASSSTDLIVEGPLSDHGTDSILISRRSLSKESSLADILQGIPPIFAQKPQPVCVNEGTDVQIECSLVAIPEPNVTWYWGGRKIQNQDNVIASTESDLNHYISVLSIKKVKKSQEGVYEVKAQNREGISKIQVILKVITEEKEPPQILEPLRSTIVNENDSVILSCQVVGNPTPDIIWHRDGKPLTTLPVKSDGVTYALTLAEIKPEDAGLYSLQAKNSMGFAETTASLHVRECPGEKMEPPLFTERFQEKKIPEKGKLRLTAKVTGKPVPEITWLRNNVPLKSSTHIKESYDGEHIILEITDINSEVDAGDYKCIARNPVGKAAHGAKISVDVEKVSFTRLLENTVNVDEGEELCLECETSHTVATKWFHNGKELSGMDHRMVIQEGRIHRLVTKEAKLQDAGTYKCTVKKQVTESTVHIFEGKPDFLRKLQDLEVKERELAILEVEVSSETADVTWHKDGEQISEISEKFVFEKQGASRRLFIRGTSVHDEGEYTCVLGEQECTAEVTVVELPPEIITKLQDVTIAKGEKATFEIELTKGDALVRWFKDGKELQFSEHVQLSIDGKRQKLKVYNSELEDSGEYSCQVGEQTSSARLTVEEPVVEFITRLPDVSLIPLNTDATFTVELSRPNVDVKWLKKGKEIKPSERYSIVVEGSVRKLVIKKVNLDDQDEYTCKAVNVKTSSKLKVEIIETVPKINVDTLQKIYKVKKDEDVDIEVKFTATPTPKEEWFANGVVVQKSKKITSKTTETSSTLTIRKVRETDIGNYSIHLVNNCGEASAEMTLVLIEVPSPPGITDVVEITNDSITLHWKAPESDGNSPIITYILEYQDKSDSTWVRVNHNYNIVETTHKITNLVRNNEYVFRVSAMNEVGQGLPSQNTHYIEIVAPVKAEAPVVQESLKSIVIGLRQPVTLSCVISGIPAPEITWLKDEKVFQSKNVTYENCVCKYIIDESTETTAGIYSCQAKNDAGFAKTACEVKVEEPPKIEYDEALTTQKLRVTNHWKIEVKFSGYPKPDVQWTKNGKLLDSTKHCNIQVDEFSSTIAITSLNKSDSGTYTFAARNESGAKSVDFAVRVIDKPSKPEGPMVVKDIRRESVVIEWKPPADDGGLELSKYSVEKCDVEKMVWMKVADVEKDVSSYCVQQLKEDAEYMFRVIAENPVGSSEALESDTITIRSKFDKPSPPRGPLDVSGMTETAFIVAWQPPQSDGGAPILEYIVERKEVGKKAWQRIGSTTGEVTHIDVSGLKLNVSYHFRITARNDVGMSAPFAPEEPITAGKRISAPSAPTHITVIDITSKSVTLQWGQPVSTGGTELTGYIVEKRLSSAKKWNRVVTLDPSVTQYCIENLKEKSEWIFKVYAENSVGLSPPASTDLVSLKTHASPPSPPTAPLEIRSIGPNSIIIEWGIPESDGGAPIEGYTIAIRDIKKTMWMEVGRVRSDVQKLAIKDLQENHEYLIRIFARNEVGLSEPLESDEPFKVLRPTDAEQLEVDKLETTAPTLSFSTETTTSWMREAGMDADIHSYARGSLLRRDEYFFRIWYYARQLFK